MLALLAICAVVCPGIRLDEQVTSMLRDSHRDSMERLGRGYVCDHANTALRDREPSALESQC